MTGHQSVITGVAVAAASRAGGSSGPTTSDGSVDDLLSALHATSTSRVKKATTVPASSASGNKTEGATDSDVGGHACPACGKRLSSARALRAHMKLSHAMGGTAAAASTSTHKPSAAVPQEVGNDEPSPAAPSAAKADAEEKTAAPPAPVRAAVGLTEGLQKSLRQHEACVAALQAAEELLAAHKRLRSVRAEYRWAPTADSGNLLDQTQRDLRPFGGTATIGSEAPRLRQRSHGPAPRSVSTLADKVVFAGGAQSVHLVGYVHDTAKVGVVKYKASGEEVQEPVTQLVLRSGGYGENGFSGLLLKQSFIEVRLYGEHAVSGLVRGDVLDITGHLGLHPAYDIDSNAWSDDAVVHVRRSSGSLRFLCHHELPPLEVSPGGEQATP